MKSDMEDLLEVVAVFQIGRYGSMERFDVVDDAVLHLDEMHRLKVSNGGPAQSGTLMVQYSNGGEERCRFSDIPRSIEWLKRFEIRRQG